MNEKSRKKKKTRDNSSQSKKSRTNRAGGVEKVEEQNLHINQQNMYRFAYSMPSSGKLHASTECKSLLQVNGNTDERMTVDFMPSEVIRGNTF